MSRHPFGWSLPPGVSQRDIDNAYGEEPVYSPEGEEISGMLSEIAETEGITGHAYDQLEESHPKIIEIVEKLAYCRELLRATVQYLPERGPAPKCTCKGSHLEDGGGGDTYPPDFCEYHDTEWEQETLKEEVERWLK